MKQPEGYEVKGKEEFVCKLIKSIYGLKQAPRSWNTRIDEFMKKNEYIATEADHCIYVRRKEGNLKIMGLYVDDELIVGAPFKCVLEFKE